MEVKQIFAHSLVLYQQGQEVGKKSHDIRMLCIEKEIEFARGQAVSMKILKIHFSFTQNFQLLSMG